MSDRRYQEARRQAQADPSPEAQACFLRERMRAGERSALRCATCKGQSESYYDPQTNVIYVPLGKARQIREAFRASGSGVDPLSDYGRFQTFTATSMIFPQVVETRWLPAGATDCADCERTGLQPLLGGLILAAYLGHEPARLVIGWGDQQAEDGMRIYKVRGRNLAASSCLAADLHYEQLCQGLSLWGAAPGGGEVLVRAARAACFRAAEAYVLAVASLHELHDARRAVAQADRWLAAPATSNLPGNLPSEFPHLHNNGRTQAFYRLLCCLSSAHNEWNTFANGAYDAMVMATRLASTRELRQQIREEVSSWVLREPA